MEEDKLAPAELKPELLAEGSSEMLIVTEFEVSAEEAHVASGEVSIDALEVVEMLAEMPEVAFVSSEVELKLEEATSRLDETALEVGGGVGIPMDETTDALVDVESAHW